MLRKKQKIVFEDCAQQWLTEKKKTVKESTWTTYSRMLEAQLLPLFCGVPIRSITKERIRECIQQKAVSGRTDGNGGLSAKSCKDLLVVLMAVLDFAEEKYGIRNEIKKTKPREFLQSGGKISIETLTEEETRKLTRVLLLRGDGEATGILLSLYTGLRLGEVCALRWENIDLERGVLRIKTTMARVLSEDGAGRTKLIFTMPKTKNSVRDVPIPGMLLPLLEQQSSKMGFLLTGTDSYVDMRTLQNHFKRILKGNGIRPVHYHCLRHTFATNCVNLEFDIKTISEILGHSSTTVTWERYVHSSLHRKQMLMQQLSDKMCV